ncbi:MAG: glycoside hydrolase family 9 protein [Streptosporangiaceae bacterium]|nr:glycoside hydrolase family 9 protein [Streptosporangiaceae bacterium]MBV9854433.1 glycoside hydrolase family 9 protein [Streptosporangiaceae bacterium]
MRHRIMAVTAAACAALGTLAIPAVAGASPARGGSDLPAVSAAAATASAGRPAVVPVVRVDQVGYAPGAAKVAFAMLPGRVAGVRFTVTAGRRTVFRGVSRDDLGGWNSRYRAVYELNFAALRRAGTYRVHVGAAVSPPFRVAPGGALYGRLVDNAVRFFTSERDGADVVHSVLDREPANLTDARAQVYAAPKYDSNDNLLGSFRRIGGPVNVSGGWFDAGGGYEKFGYTVSYADALLLIAARDNPRGYPTLRPEAQFGLRWITKLWNPAARVLYMQVGIGNGNASNTIQGDYNFWFLPQREDRLNVSRGGNPGPSAYYVKYRPVFEAAAPGRPVDPDFAGRYAADFALGAQLAGRGPAGLRLLSLARSVYADARTAGVGQILTTYPHDYYPGSEWKSDMLWGAAEIALADERLGVGRGRLRSDLSAAARWARAYIAQGHPAGGDTLNLYDTGAVAEAELLRAVRQAPRHGHQAAPVISPRVLVNDLGAQLRTGEALAAGDPFGAGARLGASDAAPHAFGLWVTGALYRAYGGSARYQAFAQQQLNFALGGNAWGSSFVVGAGSVYPRCMQSEIANLAGSLTGHGNIQLGAATDGPGNPANFSGLPAVAGMRACSAGSYSAFNSPAAAYEDNVVSWPSVEPADDYTAVSLLAFALGAGGSASPGSGAAGLG